MINYNLHMLTVKMRSTQISIVDIILGTLWAIDLKKQKPKKHFFLKSPSKSANTIRELNALFS